jgi:hypothetical protein
MRSFVRCGIANDAGVLFNTADTEHGASLTRSATVRRLTTFLSGIFSLVLFRILKRPALPAESTGFNSDNEVKNRMPFVGNQNGKFGWSSATVQKMYRYSGADRPDSPTQKIHRKDQYIGVVMFPIRRSLTQSAEPVATLCAVRYPQKDRDEPQPAIPR